MGGAERSGDLAERVFLGTVLATATHEMNNRLATLRETAGLIADLLGAAKGPGAAAAREAAGPAAGLGEQVGGLASLVRHLATLADALRAPAAVEANRAVEELVGLTERLARQRQVRIVRECAPSLPAVDADPIAFRLLVHELLAAGAEACPPREALRVRTLRDGARVGVRVSPCRLPGGGADLRGAAARAGAAIEEAAEGVTAWFATTGTKAGE